MLLKAMNTTLKLKKIILFCGDIIILYASLWLTLVIRYQKIDISQHWQQHIMPFSLIFVLWLIIFYINNLYDLKTARNNITFYSTLTKSLIWCAAVAVTFFYLFQAGIAPKTNLFIQLLFFALLFALWRRLFNQIANTKILSSHVLIIGLSSISINLASDINNKPQLGFKVLAVTDHNQEKLFTENENPIPLTDIEIITEPFNLSEIITTKKITTIINTLDLRQNEKIMDELYQSLSQKIAIFDLSIFLEKFTGKVPVNAIGQIWFLENLKEENKSFYESGKRIFDILISFVALIISLPFIPLLYAIVKTNSHGPFLFKQIRTGKDGKKFLAIKIRTMHKNAENFGPQWATKNDPRVTKSGRFLRKTRIDEIPQLINVLRGEMSFIGPRPERPEFVEQLTQKIPFYNQRHLIKPGLTGWAQINFPYGASEADALEKLQYDLYYIKNRSFALDLSILLKTIKTVLSGGGR